MGEQWADRSAIQHGGGGVRRTGVKHGPNVTLSREYLAVEIN